MTQKTIAQQLNVKEFPFQIRDKNGNKVYYENSDGRWCKNEYDSKGNCIYYEDSDGYWCKSEYDDKGNEIYSESSTEYWYKKEYDSKGNQIYYENSIGIIRDNRPKSLCEGKIVEIDGKKYQLKELK